VTDEQVLEAIAEVARIHLGYTGPVRPEMKLVEELSLDSLKLLTLAVEVENRFRIRLDPELDHELETVADLVEAVRKAHVH
jgi:acyl carrier protein